MFPLKSTAAALLLAGQLFASGPSNAQAVDPRLYGSLHWRLLGPFRAGWASTVAGVPDKPDTYYFGAAGGGIWKTDDSGRTWTSVFDQGGSSAIGSIAVAPSNSNVIYAGAGQPEPRYDVQSGRGVYRSSDGGRTWSNLGLADTRYIGRIWVSPTDPNTVMVAAVGHFFGPSNARGIFRSADGGKTWAHVLAPDEWTGANDIASDPLHPRTLFASTWQGRQWPWQSYFTPPIGPGSAIYRSDDDGLHWKRLSGGGWPTGPLGRINVQVTRKDGKLRVYAVVASKTDGGLWRSDDGGEHWRRVNSESAFANYYFNRFTVDPRDPDVVYTVGQSMRRCDRGGERCEIFRGSPGGDDYHEIWINPRHPERMIAGSDQGAAVTVNGTATWSDWYNQPTGQFYHVATDNRFPYWVYSGQQDSGTVGIASRSDYGAPNWRDWHPVGGDERDYDIPDPVDPNIIYGSGLGGHISRWDARTGQVTDISPWPVSNYGLRPTTVKHHFNWVTPLVPSRSGPPALYLGGEVVFRSLDRGDNWSIISPDLTGKVAGAQRCDGDVAIADATACGYGTITALEPSPASAAEIWAGTDSGLVQVTRDGGANWTQLPLPGVRSWAKISSIDLSSLNPAVAYVAVDGQRLDDFTPHAFRTADGGRSWTEIDRGLPTDQIVSVVRADPVRPGLLYAGTETSVFVSFDDGDHWQPLRQNLPTAWARDLTIHGDDLVVGTQGRSIWVLGDLALLRQLSPGSATTAPKLFVPAPAIHVRNDNNHDTPLAPETPVGENPPEGAVIDYWLPSSAKQPVTLEIRDSNGQIIRRFSSGDQPAEIPAERYFQAGWVKPQPVLAAGAGQHRWVWDLRKERPREVEYGYTIAAVWGLDTPLVPQGQMVAPGRYTLVLNVDGREQRAPLDVVADPRVIGADYVAANLFSDSLYAPLAQAWQGYAEMSAVREVLTNRIKAIHDPSLAAEAKALAAKLEPPAAPNSGFDGESGTLASLETSAEGSDSPPTAAMIEIARETTASIQSDWQAWEQIKGGDLNALNRRLVAAGLQPIAIPPPSQLSVGEPKGGEELP